MVTRLLPVWFAALMLIFTGCAEQTKPPVTSGVIVREEHGKKPVTDGIDLFENSFSELIPPPPSLPKPLPQGSVTVVARSKNVGQAIVRVGKDKKRYTCALKQTRACAQGPIAPAWCVNSKSCTEM